MCRNSCGWFPGTLGLVVVAALATGGCHGPGVWVEEERELHLDGKGLSSLGLFTHNGEVQVFPAVTSDDSIEVRVSLRVSGANQAEAEQHLRKLQVYDEAAKENSTRREVRWRWTEKPQGAGAVVSYEVHMPPTLELNVETHNGPVHVEGIRGACRLKTHNGSVRANDVARTSLKIETHNGEIEARTAAEQVSLNTHNGSVSAWLTSPLELSGDIRTHNGSVQAYLGPDVAAELHCQTHNGKATAEGVSLSDPKSGRNWLQGRLGIGGKKLEISSHNGGVQLKPLTAATEI